MVKVKVKFTLEQATKAQRWSRSIALIFLSTLSLTSTLDGVGGQRHDPVTLPSGKTQYPLCRRHGGPHSLSGQVRKISPPTGFDTRTVQPIASRYTDWTIPTPSLDTVLSTKLVGMLTDLLLTYPRSWEISWSCVLHHRLGLVCYDVSVMVLLLSSGWLNLFWRSLNQIRNELVLNGGRMRRIVIWVSQPWISGIVYVMRRSCTAAGTASWLYPMSWR